MPRRVAAAQAWRGVSASLVDEEAPEAADRLMEAVASTMETLCVADEIEAFAAEAGVRRGERCSVDVVTLFVVVVVVACLSSVLCVLRVRLTAGKYSF